MSTALGISPTSRGTALAAMDEYGNVTETVFTKDDLIDDMISWVLSHGVSRAIIEEPSTSAADTARAYWWIGLLEGHQIRVEKVSKTMWHYVTLQQNIRARQETRQRAAMDFAQQKYNINTVSYMDARAVCLAHYLLHHCRSEVRQCW